LLKRLGLRNQAEFFRCPHARSGAHGGGADGQFGVETEAILRREESQLRGSRNGFIGSL
jgi:hypothetical protein